MPAVTLNGNMCLEIFIVGQNGELYHRWQTNPNNGWNSTWESLGGDWPVTPVVASDAYGDLNIFGKSNYGQLYYMENVQPGMTADQWWTFADRPAGSQPVVVMNADRRLEVFILGAVGERAGKLYHRWQNKSQTDPPLYGWNRKWEDLGGPWGSLPVVATNADGSLEIFIISENRDLSHTWQTQPNDGWKDWQSLGGDWPSKVKNPTAGKEWLNLPVVARNDSVLYGDFEVFMVGHDKNLYHSWRDSSPNDRWNYNWQSLGGPFSSIPVVGSNPDGSLQVFILKDDGVIYRRWQLSSDFQWRGGRRSGDDFVGGPVSNIPVVANSADGRLHMFIVHNDNRQLYHAWQEHPDSQTGGSFYTFESLGGDWPSIPLVAHNSDGRLEIFIVGQDRQLYHRWQTNPNNGWNSTWESLGGDWPSIP